MTCVDGDAQQYITQDIVKGLSWVEGLINDELQALYDEMEQESNLLLSLYVILVRILPGSASVTVSMLSYRQC